MKARPVDWKYRVVPAARGEAAGGAPGNVSRTLLGLRKGVLEQLLASAERRERRL
jgi:hypothetical protein